VVQGDKSQSRDYLGGDSELMSSLETTTARVVKGSVAGELGGLNGADPIVVISDIQ
jgi:hypothetical protein